MLPYVHCARYTPINKTGKEEVEDENVEEEERGKKNRCEQIERRRKLTRNYA